MTRLTVHRDLDTARVRRGHTVVGDAFELFGLMSFDIRDVQELSLVHAAICEQKTTDVRASGHLRGAQEDAERAGEPNMLLLLIMNKA